MNKKSELLAISIEEVEDFGIITLKANILDTEIIKVVELATGVTVPQVGKISIGKKLSVGWMSTDEYAVILPGTLADGLVNKISNKMKKYHHLCINMSDSRRCFRLRGERWREVLSKGTPVNLHPAAFNIGSFRRTRICNVAVAFWSAKEDEAYLISMVSESDFVSTWLRTAGLKTGEIVYY